MDQANTCYLIVLLNAFNGPKPVKQNGNPFDNCTFKITHTCKLWLISDSVKQPNPGSHFPPCDPMERSEMFHQYLYIVRTRVSICPLVLSFWLMYISTLFVLQVWLSNDFISKSIYRQITINVFYHALKKKKLLLRGTSYNFFFCKKDLLKCCNICGSEDKTYYKVLQPVYTLEK